MSTKNPRHFGARILALAGLSLALAFAAWAVRSAHAQDAAEARPAAPAAPTDEEIRGWVRQLGAEDAKVRNQAAESLRQAGAAALAALQEATKSPDAEVAWRAGSLAREIQAARKQAEKADGAPEAGTRAGDDDAEDAPRRPRRWVVRPGGGHVQIHTTVSGEINGTRYTMTRGSEGGVKLDVTGPDGKKSTYEADSVEEFKKKYPDQAREYGVDEETGGLKIHIGKGNLGRLLGGEEMTDEELEEFRKQAEEMSRKFQKMLEGRFRNFDEEMNELRKGLEQGPRGGGDFDKAINQLFRRLGRELGGEEEDPEAPEDPKAGPEPGRDGRQAADAGSARFGAKAGNVDEALRYQLDLPDDRGVVLSEVPKDSGAARVGLRQFDVVTDVNGAEVKGKWEFRRLLGEALTGGGKVRLDVIRHGKKQTVEFSPDELAAPAEPKGVAPLPEPKTD